MRTYLAIGFGFTLTALAVGCGSSDTEVGSEKSGYEAYVAAVSKLLCESGASCCAGSNFLLDECLLFLPSFAQRPAPDKFVFNEELVDPCLAETRVKTACADVPEVCHGVTRGLVPPGERCSTQLECMPPGPEILVGFCEGPEGEMRCRAAAKLGETCGASCAGQSCTYYSFEEGGICFEEQGLRCGPTSRVCEAIGSQGAPCTSDEICAEGLECAGGTCIPLPDVGESCAFDCQKGSYCNAGVCEAGLPLGAACLSTRECREGSCDLGVCSEDEGGDGFVCLFFGGGP